MRFDAKCKSRKYDWLSNPRQLSPVLCRGWFLADSMCPVEARGACNVPVCWNNLTLLPLQRLCGVAALCSHPVWHQRARLLWLKYFSQGGSRPASVIPVSTQRSTRRHRGNNDAAKLAKAKAENAFSGMSCATAMLCRYDDIVSMLNFIAENISLDRCAAMELQGATPTIALLTYD